MKRVIGIGGIFFKSKDPKALSEWYEKHLGVVNPGWGAQFFVNDLNTNVKEAYQLWSPFKENTTYFGTGNQSFMINFIVDNLDALAVTLQEEGIDITVSTEVSEFGKFGWCTDPEGTKIELWEPPK
jgi:predicted enzyme related to lactoylglutathione lyase